jgi:hypothetical protein
MNEGTRCWCLGVGITKLDGDVPDEFILESDGHDTRDGFHDRRFSVGDMPDCACSTRKVNDGTARDRPV